VPTTEQLLTALDRRVGALQKARPELADALSLQQQLIRTALSSARPPHAPPFPLPREAAAARVRQGVPLLHEQPIRLDIHFAADLFSRLVNVVRERNDPEVQPRVNALVEAATSGALDPNHLFTEAFVEHADHLSELAISANVDAELLSALAHQAVGPMLRAYASHLQPRLEDEGWQRGYCPVCGAWPLLGELRGVELARFSRCGACGAGWRTQRLGCPYCGNDDYRTLQTLTIEDEQRFRVSVCDRCKGYLKIANAFDPPPAELLALDDVASMHLDVAAIERGYHRPGGSGFTIELAVPDDEWTEELD
jgi:FdhE protein